MAEIHPFGAWPSPLSAVQIAAGGVRLGALSLSGDDVYWIESRPSEGGRQALLRHSGGRTAELTPPDFNARTRVHEYGGGEHWVSDGTVFATSFVDQRIYRLDETGARTITPAAEEPAADRYADGDLSPDGKLLFCVREHHRGSREAVNELVVLPPDGSGEPRVVFSGADFVSSPRVSPDGRELAWLSWDHPCMPWDGTWLYTATIGADGELTNRERIAGAPDESVVQPRWSPEGTLYFISDRSGWWNLYAWRDGAARPLVPRASDFAGPDWVFGLSSYDFSGDGRLICSYQSPEGTHLARLDPQTGALEPIPCPYSQLSYIRSKGEMVAFVGASATVAAQVVVGPVDGSDWQVLSRSRSDELEAGHVSIAEAIAFPTTDDATAHALYYAPRHAEVRGPSGERPPLLVISHGGPTSAASAAYDPAIQFWTTRGIAVVDVNYRGSTGYGRDYRRALNGRWGRVDTDDCIAAARYLVERGDVDGDRLCIRGGSAGGYTTLCALTFHDLFRAGASYYGVADAETLASDTHKFESRYLDTLIGPYPEAANTYRERSPIHFAHEIRAAVILFQGLEDEIVPPSQAEEMVRALSRSGLPHSYLAFPGEQHGFRRAENIVQSLEAELSFYGQVLGFDPVGVARVPINRLRAEDRAWTTGEREGVEDEPHSS